MKIISMLRVRTTPPQPLFHEYTIIIITTEKNQTNNWGKKKRGGGVIPTLNMFMIFMNRKTLN